MAIFRTIFLRQYRAGKCLLRYSRTKKRISRLGKIQVQKVEKLTFSKRVNPLFWSKMAIFPTFFFQYRPGKCPYVILERKTFFCAIKTTSSISRKIDIFPKGLTDGFGREIAIFSTFFL